MTKAIDDPSVERGSTIRTATASGLRDRFSRCGGDALPDYELLELVLFRVDPAPGREADRQGAAQALRHLRRSSGRAAGTPDGGRRDRREHRHRSQGRGGRGPAARQGRGRASGRSCPRGRRLSTIAAPRWPSATRSSSASCSSTSATRLIADEVQQIGNGRPHAGLSPRGRQARARTLRLRLDPRAQPPIGRSRRPPPADIR